MDLCDLHFNYNRKNYKVSVLNEIIAMVFNNINKIREKLKVERRVSKYAKKRRLWLERGYNRKARFKMEEIQDKNTCWINLLSKFVD